MELSPDKAFIVALPIPIFSPGTARVNVNAAPERVLLISHRVPALNMKMSETPTPPPKNHFVEHGSIP